MENKSSNTQPEMNQSEDARETIKISNENHILRRTGISSNGKHTRYRFSTQDLLISAILGVMGGFISGLIKFSLLVKTWYPFVGGTQLVSGHHLLWMAIAYGLTQKKGTIFLTAFIQGFVNFLFGSQWGILEVGITLYEGLFLFGGFLLVEHLGEKMTYFGWGLTGGIANFFQVPLFWLITGKIFFLHWSLFVMACLFGFLSGVFISGLLGVFIIKRIEATGVV